MCYEYHATSWSTQSMCYELPLYREWYSCTALELRALVERPPAARLRRPDLTLLPLLPARYNERCIIRFALRAGGVRIRGPVACCALTGQKLRAVAAELRYLYAPYLEILLACAGMKATCLSGTG